MPARISLCLIAKNAEASLPQCLPSVAGVVHEMIVVDSGSADRTKDIAASLGARVFDFAWVDSFAAARDQSLRHATGDWIFWLGADEYLDADNRGKLKALFDQLHDEPAAYVLRQRSAQANPGDPPTLVDQCRLFRNHPDLRWSDRVHEQILPTSHRLGHQVGFTDLCIDHSGYTDPATGAQKDQRNLRLLHLEEAEQPHDPFTLFNLGWAYQALGQPDRALAYLRQSLKRADPAASIVRKLFALIAQTYDKRGQRREALAWCRAGRVRFPDDGEPLFREGVLLKSARRPPRRRGGLAQTAGFARLVPWGEDRAAYLDRFVAATLAALEQLAAAALESDLRRRADQVNATSPWPALAGRWSAWLNELE
jgi:tetratricopeptide (TPR) repeat protein